MRYSKESKAKIERQTKYAMKTLGGVPVLARLLGHDLALSRALKLSFL